MTHQPEMFPIQELTESPKDECGVVGITGVADHGSGSTARQDAATPIDRRRGAE